MQRAAGAGASGGVSVSKSRGASLVFFGWAGANEERRAGEGVVDRVAAGVAGLDMSGARYGGQEGGETEDEAKEGEASAVVGGQQEQQREEGQP